MGMREKKMETTIMGLYRAWNFKHDPVALNP